MKTGKLAKAKEASQSKLTQALDRIDQAHNQAIEALNEEWGVQHGGC